MKVAELWRYPVKSMAGERLDQALVTDRGIVGDRVVHVRLGGGLVSARTHHRLLGLHARLGDDGEPVIDGQPWMSSGARAAVVEAAGAGAALVRYDGRERFDVLPLLIATDGAIAALGVDHRRLRPNIVVADVDGLTERGWPGRRLRIGETIIDVAKLRSRCVMTTFDPDTLAQDVSVLRRIAQQFGGKMALDCDVVQGGLIRVGDPVVVLDDAAREAGGTR
jgi:uncharacterized protein YcbX